MFKPGQSGNPKGRPKGVRDRRLDFYDVWERLDEAKHDPIKALIIMAKDENLEQHIRLKANVELLARVAPVLKAVDHRLQVEEKPEEIKELERRAQEATKKFKMDH